MTQVTIDGLGYGRANSIRVDRRHALAGLNTLLAIDTPARLNHTWLTRAKAREVAEALDPDRVPREQYDLLVSAIEQAGGFVEAGGVGLPHIDRYTLVHEIESPWLRMVVDLEKHRVVARAVPVDLAAQLVETLNGDRAPDPEPPLGGSAVGTVTYQQAAA